MKGRFRESFARPVNERLLPARVDKRSLKTQKRFKRRAEQGDVVELVGALGASEVDFRNEHIVLVSIERIAKKLKRLRMTTDTEKCLAEHVIGLVLRNPIPDDSEQTRLFEVRAGVVGGIQLEKPEHAATMPGEWMFGRPGDDFSVDLRCALRVSGLVVLFGGVEKRNEVVQNGIRHPLGLAWLGGSGSRGFVADAL